MESDLSWLGLDELTMLIQFPYIALAVYDTEFVGNKVGTSITDFFPDQPLRLFQRIALMEACQCGLIFRLKKDIPKLLDIFSSVV